MSVDYSKCRDPQKAEAFAHFLPAAANDADLNPNDFVFVVGKILATAKAAIGAYNDAIDEVMKAVDLSEADDILDRFVLRGAAAVAAAEAVNDDDTIGVPVWRDIATAPKDGTHIIAIMEGEFAPGVPYQPAVVNWSENYGIWVKGEDAPDYSDWPLTHWMPCPTLAEGLVVPGDVDLALDGLTVLAADLHQKNVDAGWWDHGTGKYVIGTKIALIHSEVSEAMEGHRKGLMDDKLPHRPMVEVELADVLIRVFDLAGALNLDLSGAVREKLAFNAQRADHKPEARAAAGGKAY